MISALLSLYFGHLKVMSYFIEGVLLLDGEINLIVFSASLLDFSLLLKDFLFTNFSSTTVQIYEGYLVIKFDS